MRKTRYLINFALITVLSGCGTTGDPSDNQEDSIGLPGLVCVPDLYRCRGSDLEKCSLDGQTWDLVQTCADGEECIYPPGSCLETCVPDCGGKTCGTDGCGGSCGTCDGLDRCVDNQCQCLPDCEARLCGTDGCGGSCGDCPEGELCFEGACQVQCQGVVCSSTSCCPPYQTCRDGYCCGETDHRGCLDGQVVSYDSCGNPGKLLETCSQGCSGGVCLVCLPSCVEGLCGDDGCGGTCPCNGTQSCLDGLCVSGETCEVEPDYYENSPVGNNTAATAAGIFDGSDCCLDTPGELFGSFHIPEDRDWYAWGFETCAVDCKLQPTATSPQPVKLTFVTRCYWGAAEAVAVDDSTTCRVTDSGEAHCTGLGSVKLEAAFCPEQTEQLSLQLFLLVEPGDDFSCSDPEYQVSYTL